MNTTHKPVCLVFSGHDPCGGAGQQADIESIASNGAHAATILTCMTVQDTTGVQAVQAVSPDWLVQQARTVLDDFHPSAIKIGLIPNAAIAEALHSLLIDFPDIPVVLDPILRSGDGQLLVDNRTANAIQTLLFPAVTVLTPNSPEARYFSPGADTLDACAMSLLETGCEYVLITGGHEADDTVINRLYGNLRKLDSFNWQRLPGPFHGTGCTLASAIAALLSHGHEPHSAIREAQQYTWNSLQAASSPGRGQTLPDRFYWAK